MSGLHYCLKFKSGVHYWIEFLSGLHYCLKFKSGVHYWIEFKSGVHYWIEFLSGLHYCLKFKSWVHYWIEYLSSACECYITIIRNINISCYYFHILFYRCKYILHWQVVGRVVLQSPIVATTVLKGSALLVGRYTTYYWEKISISIKYYKLIKYVFYIMQYLFHDLGGHPTRCSHKRMSYRIAYLMDMRYVLTYM